MSARHEAEFHAFAQAAMPQLRRLAFQISGDWQRAEDAVQVSLLKVYRRWQRVSQSGTPHSYARRVVLRTLLDERRRAARRAALEPAPVEPPTCDDSDWSDSVVARQLLETLPPRQRAILFLRFMQDLSVEETAALLNCQGGTVKRQTSDALRTLRSKATSVGLSQ